MFRNGKMKILPIVVLLFPTIASAQLSGYVSANYGFHGNPLYNYEQASDQTSQSYIELHHASDFGNSSFDLGYVGGLMLFNHFGERNYYEHSLAGRWNLQVGEEDEQSGQVDSTGAYLLSELKFTARHDKSAFEVYDNNSGGLNVSYRTLAGGALFMRYSNKAEYRSYALVDELSNFTDILAISLGSRTRDRLNFEVLLSAGIKQYTSALTDTSTYETITTEQGGTGTGHGKGLGNGNAGSNSSSSFIKKQHLYANPASSTSWQFTAGGIVEKRWEKRSALLGLVYRYNPQTAVRYVAQYVNTSTLSEDIYNDHFAYEGPAADLKFSQTFPQRITAALQLQWAARTYGAPALDLQGVQIADKRTDTIVALELTLTKAFTISEGVDLEVNLTGGAARNKSNDEYNDYSAGAVALGVAVGF